MAASLVVEGCFIHMKREYSESQWKLTMTFRILPILLMAEFIAYAAVAFSDLALFTHSLLLRCSQILSASRKRQQEAQE